jgi:hypothetical protein
MPLTRNPEKTAAIVKAVECHPTWSDKRIAMETHTSRTVVWKIRRYILHEQKRQRGPKAPETEAQIISLLNANEKYKTIAAMARCSISTVVKVARANGLSRSRKIKARGDDPAV